MSQINNENLNNEFARYISAQAQQLKMLDAMLRSSFESKEHDCHASAEDGCEGCEAHEGFKKFTDPWEKGDRDYDNTRDNELQDKL